uniref:Diguanylate cyclase n=1 Tax=Heterorhabditis bacteriophora TaxID=37862 RepID=A0A1I7WRD7_HETBA
MFDNGFPAFVLTLYGFLGLTLSPARLYDEAYRSKTCLCLNAVVWQPYRPEIYQIAMSLSSHMEQSNMGITIWGFAILTKPLILATFSVMAMIMSLLMEIVPQRNDKETK